jgi:hypothetical protein
VVEGSECPCVGSSFLSEQDEKRAHSTTRPILLSYPIQSHPVLSVCLSACKSACLSVCLSFFQFRSLVVQEQKKAIKTKPFPAVSISGQKGKGARLIVDI